MNITSINQNYTNNKQSQPSFSARLNDFEPLIKSLNSLNDQGDDFFKYLDENSRKIKNIKLKNLSPDVNVEINERNEEVNPLNFIVFSDLSENIFGDTIFKYNKYQSGAQNGRKFINAIRKATKSMKQFKPFDKQA